MAASVHILPLDHSRMRQGHADGITMPEVYEPVAEHLPKVKAMEVKDGEVFLTAYPKSVPFTGWFNHADQVTNYKKKHPHVPIFSLSYEELSANPKLCVKKLAEFLGVTASPQLIDDIVANTVFQTQKQIEEENDPKQRDLSFYRKGDVNDWKNYFTEEMKEKYNQKLKERAAHCPFSAEYVD